MVGTDRTSAAQSLRKWGLAVAAVMALGASPPSWARGPAVRAIDDVTLASLPAEAARTHAAIVAGGPFPYAKDGSVFGNRERLLPPRARGYYREYTVPTPGAAHRGARRIVCGGDRPTRPDTCFYTGDHYARFSRIVP